jgi:HlyD family secretion protein
MIGRVRLGQSAQIWTDAFPDTPFAATVGYIASRAEFTPKEVQTREERTKLVYEVRLYPTADPAGKLLPGQPADGMIRYLDDTPWQPPRP